MGWGCLVWFVFCVFGCLVGGVDWGCVVGVGFGFDDICWVDCGFGVGGFWYVLLVFDVDVGLVGLVLGCSWG